MNQLTQWLTCIDPLCWVDASHCVNWPTSKISESNTMQKIVIGQFNKIMGWPVAHALVTILNSVGISRRERWAEYKIKHVNSVIIVIWIYCVNVWIVCWVSCTRIIFVTFVTSVLLLVWYPGKIFVFKAYLQYWCTLILLCKLGWYIER